MISNTSFSQTSATYNKEFPPMPSKNTSLDKENRLNGDTQKKEVPSSKLFMDTSTLRCTAEFGFRTQPNGTVEVGRFERRLNESTGHNELQLASGMRLIDGWTRHVGDFDTTNELANGIKTVKDYSIFSRVGDFRAYDFAGLDKFLVDTGYGNERGLESLNPNQIYLDETSDRSWYVTNSPNRFYSNAYKWENPRLSRPESTMPYVGGT
ncbi:hypothetical protein HOH87_06855 [bacterium]|nr:hypothetical protein [bacterium]